MAAPADLGVPGGEPATDEAPPAGARRSVLQVGVEREALLPLAAAALVVVHLALRVWTAAGGWYTGLDLAGTVGTVTGAVEVPGPPGAAALTRALASVAPLSWPALAASGN